MLLEVLESVISLETYPFVKRHYTEVAHVGSLTPLLVYCAHTAYFFFECSLFTILTRV
jgi:hypothetical protein